MLTKETYAMLSPPILIAIRNATSSRGSEAGQRHCVLPGGPTIDKPGPDRLLVNLSARQAAAEGLLTSGTYGLPSIISSASADLQSSLENRLKQRLPTGGLTLFK